MGGLMQGKRGLIMGLANDKSLAWGIAKKLHEEGAEMAYWVARKANRPWSVTFQLFALPARSAEIIRSTERGRWRP